VTEPFDWGDSAAVTARLARMTLDQHAVGGAVCEWCTAVQGQAVAWPCGPRDLATRALVHLYRAMAKRTGGRVAGGGSGPGCPLDELPMSPLGTRFVGLPDGSQM
jgi:hypothetical protein